MKNILKSEGSNLAATLYSEKMAEIKLFFLKPFNFLHQKNWLYEYWLTSSEVKTTSVSTKADYQFPSMENSYIENKSIFLR
jgi:hypothetical protein